MVVILVLSTFVVFLVIDHFVKPVPSQTYVCKGTQITTQGFEMLGALAQDGGTRLEEEAETEEVMSKMKRTMEVGASK